MLSVPLVNNGFTDGNTKYIWPRSCKWRVACNLELLFLCSVVACFSFRVMGYSSCNISCSQFNTECHSTAVSNSIKASSDQWECQTGPVTLSKIQCALFACAKFTSSSTPLKRILCTLIHKTLWQHFLSVMGELIFPSSACSPGKMLLTASQILGLGWGLCQAQNDKTLGSLWSQPQAHWSGNEKELLGLLFQDQQKMLYSTEVIFGGLCVSGVVC